MKGDPYAALADGFLDHYGTLRGIVRHVSVDRQLRRHIPAPPAAVLDIGGGAGDQSLPLARDGYHVTILDPSDAMLAQARARLRDESPDTRARVELIQGWGENGPALFAPGAFRVVLCHGVLMYLEDPAPILRAIGHVAGSGAVVSILAKNGASLALRPALQGRFQEALQAFDADRDVGGLGVVTRGDTPERLTAALREVHVEVVEWYGVRVLTDHLMGEPPGPDLEVVLEAEWEAGRRDPYRSMGRLIHLLGRRLA